MTVDGTGRIGAKILWYNTADQTFDADGDKEEKEALKELRLGQIYENGDQLKEAIDAYTKAVKSTSPVTRAAAYDGIGRATRMQMSFWNKYLFSGIGRIVELHGVVGAHRCLAADCLGLSVASNTAKSPE